MSGEGKVPRSPKFPTHNAPRVWFLTNANSPIGLSLCRHLVAHGDHVVAGVHPLEFEREAGRSEDLRAYIEELMVLSKSKDAGEAESASQGPNGKDKDKTNKGRAGKEAWRSRLRIVALDTTVMGQCQSAMAQALQWFHQVDILFCCQSEAVVGTVEELSQTTRGRSLVNEQFEANFFGPVNIIQAALPTFRANKNGHIILLTAVTAHLGTPGLSIYCASQWAIEGYCDSLAYEVAPFNIKTTIVQPNIEVNVLTSRITSAPPMACYSEENHPAPLFRNILSSLLDRIDGAPEPTTGDQLHSNRVTSIYPPLSKTFKEHLVAETVHAVAAIGGHDNPPARHIVSSEGVASVKEKLKTVTEELEDFVECSCAVDIVRDDTVTLS